MGKKIFSTLVVIFLFTSTISASLFEKSEYAARRAKLMATVSDGIVIILGAQSRTDYNEFYQNNDFMYFSGVEIPNAILVIDGIKKESILFYTISERSARGEGISLEMINNPEQVTGIEKVLPIAEFSDYLAARSSEISLFHTPFLPGELARECSREKLRTLRRTMTSNEWDGRQTREQRFVEKLKEKFPNLEVKDCSEKIWDLRIIKSAAEIDLMRKAAKIAVKAHIELIKTTRVGMHERELAAFYEYYCRKEGAQDLAYYMVLCSAENHPYVHYHEYDRVLEDGDFLVIDVGPDYGYYDIDITISYPVNGKFTPRQKEIYLASKAVHEISMSLYKPGASRNDVREKVREILIEKGFDLDKEIFKKRTMQGGFGHYVGMAVHDVGGSPSVLKPGMVFANEPYATFADENLGIRIEDTILITEDGYENLTAGIPREIEEIEALMKKEGAIQVLKKAGLY